MCNEPQFLRVSNEDQKMSYEPRKRLVGLLEYGEIWLGSGIAFAFAIASACGGVVCLALAVLMVVLGFSNFEGGPDTSTKILGLFMGSLFGVGFFGAMCTAKALFATFRESEPIELITPQTAKDLPPKEILVRASDLPPSQQQAELLRAAGQKQATPAEELLRAGEKTRQD